MKILIGFFIIFALFLTFIVLNLDNKSNVNFGFEEFRDVPIYISVFISMFVGMIFSIPFMASFRKKNGTPKIKNGFGGGKNRQTDKLDEIQGENGPYGIN